MRLHILDGMRGHLLIGMMLAHLGFQQNQGFLLTVHHTRLVRLYDAEFFVLISGFLVGVLFAARPSIQERFLQFVAKRLGVIYKYYLVSTIPFLYFAARRNDFSFPFEEALLAVFLQDGGSYSDILPIYFFCFLLLAVSFYLFRGRDEIILFASASIYFASQFTYQNGFFGLSDSLVVFDIGAWQFLFIGSFWIGKKNREIRTYLSELPVGLVTTLTIVLWVSSVLLPRIFEYVPLAELPESIANTWPRFQLHPFHLFRIIIASLAVTFLLISSSVLLLPFRKFTEIYFSLPFLKMIGSYSIQMFTLHVFLLAIYKKLAPSMSVSGSQILSVSMVLFFIASPYLALMSVRWLKSIGVVRT